jgi:hypothetical protein
MFENRELRGIFRSKREVTRRKNCINAVLHDLHPSTILSQLG